MKNERKKSSSSFYGMFKYCFWVFVLLLIGRLTGDIHISFWWVISPLFLFAILFFLLCALGAYMESVWDDYIQALTNEEFKEKLKEAFKKNGWTLKDPEEPAK